MLKQQKHTYSKNLTTLTKQGLYDPTFEHDACGVGLVANIDGTKSHHIINQSLEVLINLGHRGAAGADPETGDGAGIMIQMPDEFFRKECAKEQIDLPNINSCVSSMSYDFCIFAFIGFTHCCIVSSYFYIHDTMEW